MSVRVGFLCKYFGTNWTHLVIGNNFPFFSESRDFKCFTMFYLYLDSTVPSLGQWYKLFSLSRIVVFTSAGGPCFFNFTCLFVLNFVLKDLSQFSPRRRHFSTTRTVVSQNKTQTETFFVVRNGLEFFCSAMVSYNRISYSHLMDVISFKNNQPKSLTTKYYKLIFTNI